VIYGVVSDSTTCYASLAGNPETENCKANTFRKQQNGTGVTTLRIL